MTLDLDRYFVNSPNLKKIWDFVIDWVDIAGSYFINSPGLEKMLVAFIVISIVLMRLRLVVMAMLAMLVYQYYARGDFDNIIRHTNSYNTEQTKDIKQIGSVPFNEKK